MYSPPAVPWKGINSNSSSVTKISDLQTHTAEWAASLSLVLSSTNIEQVRHIRLIDLDWSSNKLLRQLRVAEKLWDWFFNQKFYFFFFTNQGYPLQNSSLGQLHRDGGIVPIVRSSAGRLLLVYLSARRLRTTGYYPKYQNSALSSGFWAAGIKTSHRDWDPANRGLRNHRNAFSCQKFIDGDCLMTWGIVVVQHPSACNAWTHTCHPFPESFKDFPIKSLIDSLSWWRKFLVDDLRSVKKNKWASIWYWICSFSLSWDGESLQYATPDFGVLSRGRTPKSMIHHLW